MDEEKNAVLAWRAERREREHSQDKPQPNDNHQSPEEMWQEFTDNTTLHGIRHIFTKYHILVRLIWLMLLLASGGYYISTVYRAFNKYYNRPIHTIVRHKNVEKMEFPAVTICPLNMFAKSKILMTDDDQKFASSGLNISTCAVTAGVRGDRPCGMSLLCCCAPTDFKEISTAIPNCTSQYRYDLLDAMQQTSHHPDVDGFFWNFSPDIKNLLGPMCKFGWDESPCSEKDFLPILSKWLKCYTFNSGSNGTIKTVYTGGASSGLSIILDTKVHDYSYSKFESEGFKVLIHKQGEYIDQWQGINVGPGQHAVVAFSEKRVGPL